MMGMYTEIYVNIDLKDDTPDEVIDILQKMVSSEDLDLPDWCPRRWEYMFHCSSYLPNTHVAILNKCNYLGYSLLGKGSIKNYGNEIEDFFKWIAPWSDTEFLGYSLYEEDEKPKLYYRKDLVEVELVNVDGKVYNKEELLSLISLNNLREIENDRT